MVTAYWRGCSAYEQAGGAIRIGNPAIWQAATAARNEPGGAIEMDSDARIAATWRLLAKTKGMSCEPASVAGAAGVISRAGRKSAGGEVEI